MFRICFDYNMLRVIFEKFFSGWVFVFGFLKCFVIMWCKSNRND